MNIWWKYLFFYVIGVAIALASPRQQLIESLNILGPITLTALFASLLVPFAGLADNERTQRFSLQFAIIPLFGVYTVLLWHTASIGGIILLISAAGVHVSYWTTSYHSRQYRLEQYRTGFASTMPATTRLIAKLNGTGRSHLADTIIQSLLSGKTPDFCGIDHPLLTAAREETGKL